MDKNHDELCSLIKGETALSDDEFSEIFLNDAGVLVGYGHVDVIDNLEEPHLDRRYLELLRRAYIYLAASLFATDRICDGQSKNLKLDLLANNIALAKAISIAHDLSNLTNTSQLIEFIVKLMIKNRDAISDEPACFDLTIETKEYIESAYDRAYLFVTAYEMMAKIKKIPVRGAFDKFCKSFLYYMQEGDDLGDWREDFRANRTTPFLRRCFQKIGYKPSSEQELEEFVYLSGVYERDATIIAEGLDESLHYLDSDYNSARVELIKNFVDRQISRIRAVANNFERVKQGLPPVQISILGN